MGPNALWKPAAKLDKKATEYVSRKFKLMLSALQVGTILQAANKCTEQSDIQLYADTQG